MKTFDFSAFAKGLGKNKILILFLIFGLALILIPWGGAQKTQKAGEANPLEATGVSLETESDKLALLLTQINGVGRADVLLSGKGAIVVCDGALSAEVRLNVTNAVMAYTGLGSDKISVMKMK